jgi:hypothetical protein
MAIPGRTERLQDSVDAQLARLKIVIDESRALRVELTEKAEARRRSNRSISQVLGLRKKTKRVARASRTVI